MLGPTSDKHWQRVIACSSIGIDDSFAFHGKASNTMAFGDVSRREHDFLCIKTEVDTVIGELNPSRGAVKEFQLGRAHVIVGDVILAGKAQSTECGGHLRPQAYGLFRGHALKHGEPLWVGKRLRREHHQIPQSFPLRR